MKTMLKLTVVSFVFAMTVQAVEPAAPHAGAQTSPGQASTQAVQQTAPAKSKVVQFMEAFDACMRERGGKSGGLDAASASRALSK